MKSRSWGAVMALSFLSHYYVGFSMELSRVSPNPMEAYQGSSVVFKWTLEKEITSRPNFEELVFGVWKNGYLSTYITTVTKTGRIIPNPELLQRESQFHGRVQWKGDLSQSVAAFEISNVDSRDQMDYGLVLNFGFFSNSLSNVISLTVKERGSSITALSSSHEAPRPGENASLVCEFYVHDKDKPVFQGVILGLCARGGISLTLVSLTREERLIMNPDLDQEGPDYLYRTEANHQGLNKTSNKTRVSLSLRNVTVADDGVYGCSMDFGPFREPIVSLVDIEVKGSNSHQDLPAGNNPVPKSYKVRVGKNTEIRCPVLYEVIHMDGTFEGLRWSYCVSKTCNGPDTEWLWLAGMAQQGAIKVNQTGSYARRVNLTRNGTLEINQVRPEDATDYRCIVDRINYTSPRNYFASLVVDTTVAPRITNKSKSQVTVIEGETLYLACEVEGNPQPVVSWEKHGHVLQNSTEKTSYIRHSTKKDDTGHYECKATNLVGSDSYAVDVTVKGHEDNGNRLSKLTVALIVSAVCILAVIGVAGFFACYGWRRRSRQYDSIHSVAKV